MSRFFFSHGRPRAFNYAGRYDRILHGAEVNPIIYSKYPDVILPGQLEQKLPTHFISIPRELEDLESYPISHPKI